MNVGNQSRATRKRETSGWRGGEEDGGEDIAVVALIALMGGNVNSEEV